MESGTPYTGDSDDAECASCAFPTTLLTWYNTQRIGKREWQADGYWLCSFCAHTHVASMTVFYPEQYPGQSMLAKTIAYSHNALLTAIHSDER